MSPTLSLDGERLKRLRLQRALTQLDLGEMAAVHAVTLSRLENGAQRANVGTIRRLAKALDVEITDLATITEPVA